MLSALSSLRFFVFSPPSIPSNLSPLSVDQLNGLRDSLVPFRDADLSIIVWATVLVTIGVLMEVAEIQHDVREAARELKHESKLGELKPIWKLVVAVGWMLVALGLGLEWWGDARINSVSTDLDTVNQALVQRAEGDAITAGMSAHNASVDATTARDSARDAQKDAKGARQEADSLTQEIVDAKQQSADASAKAADAVSRLADAEQRLAVATQGEANAEKELRDIKTPRSLTNASGLAESLKVFKGTQYTFVGCFQDQESIDLLVQLDKVLANAGWTRSKLPPQNGFADIVLNISKDFAVPVASRSGVYVGAQSTETVDALKSTPQPLLPEYIRAAMALKGQLAIEINPHEGDFGPLPVDPEDSTSVFIIVGKKP